MWNLSQEDDLLLAVSETSEDSHQEPVNDVHWAADGTAKGKLCNVSVVHSNWADLYVSASMHVHVCIHYVLSVTRRTGMLGILVFILRLTVAITFNICNVYIYIYITSNIYLRSTVV